MLTNDGGTVARSQEVKLRPVFFLSPAGMGYLTVRLTTTLSLGSGARAVTGTSAAEYLR